MFRNSLLAATAVAVVSAHAQAEILTVRYDFPEIANYSVLYGFFGGDQGPLDGAYIISTTLVIESYTTTGGTDAADFFMDFAVPVLDGQSEVIVLSGSDLGWFGQGSFVHSFTTDDYNGEIRPGRFGAEWIGGGTFVGDAYIEFTVDTVPAPGVLGALGLGGLLAARRRR